MWREVEWAAKRVRYRTEPGGLVRLEWWDGYEKAWLELNNVDLTDFFTLGLLAGREETWHS